MIIKTALTAPGIAVDSLLAHNVYDKEMEFYRKIVPQINHLLSRLSDPHALVAETFGVCNANKAMLFEDLTMKGYRLASIKNGFSLADARIVLRKLAIFHGCCSVLQANQPNIFANYKHGQYENRNRILSHFSKFHRFSPVQAQWVEQVMRFTNFTICIWTHWLTRSSHGQTPVNMRKNCGSFVRKLLRKVVKCSTQMRNISIRWITVTFGSIISWWTRKRPLKIRPLKMRFSSTFKIRAGHLQQLICITFWTHHCVSRVGRPHSLN